MSESNKELLTSADIKSKEKIDNKNEPSESTDSEVGVNCSTEENHYQAASSCIENSVYFGLNVIASAKTENKAHKNLIEKKDQKMKSRLNVLKETIDNVDLPSNLKANDDNYDINLDKKLYRSICELNYPAVLITTQDIDAIKASSSCIEKSVHFELNVSASAMTENKAHRNLIEKNELKMKSRLNVLKGTIDNADLSLNLKANDDNYDINLDKKLYRSICELNYPAVLITTQDIDAIKAASSCIEKSVHFELNVSASAMTENKAHRNLIEKNELKMKSRLNVLKGTIDNADLSLNLKANDDNYDINLDKKLYHSICELNYPAVLITTQDIDAIKASSSCIEKSVHFELNVSASAMTENKAHRNLIEKNELKMKSRLNVLKGTIDNADLSLNLKANDDNYDINLDKKLYRSICELNYPAVLITTQDIDAIKICDFSISSSSRVENVKSRKKHNETNLSRSNVTKPTKKLCRSDVTKPKNIFKCSFCNYETNTKTSLKSHLVIHCSTKSYKCLECSYSCKRKYTLKIHLLSSHSDVKFKCSECSYSSPIKSRLKCHILTHSNLKFRCSVCNSSFKDLKRHLLTHNLKLFRCTECQYSCNQKRNLTRHLLSHANTKLFKCSECNYFTNYKSELKIHLLKHTDIKLFKCSECGYSCNRKYHFKRHLLTHTDIKLLFCSECNYSCNQKDNLKAHLLTHTDIKLFKCAECDYKSNHKSHLKRHSLTHNKEREMKGKTGREI